MKEPRQIVILERHVISFYDETDYTSESSDNIGNYSKTFTSGDNSNMICRIGIELFEDKKIISSCLIGSHGGLTGINENSILVSHGGIVICCANTIFKLTMPNLDLEWKTISDTMTCFGIYYLSKDYVVHGELEITRLDKNGKIVWQQSGRDIWTTAEGINDFAVLDDCIVATDWEYNRYIFDFDGNVIEEYKIEPNKEI